MDCFYGFGAFCSDRESDKYIEVNNFGYYKNVDTGIFVRREKGRTDYQIIYVKNGLARVFEAGENAEAAAGSVIVYRPGEPQIYSFAQGENTGYYWIHFSGTGASELIEAFANGKRIVHIGDAFEFSETISRMRGFCIKNDLSVKAYTAGALMSLLAYLARRTERTDRAVERVIEAMQTETGGTMSNTDYARICGVSEYHFIRRFKSFTGTTPQKYRRNIMINRAIGLLNNTEMNITEIAEALGFADSLYFSRVFKKEVGVSPQKYRRQSE